MTLHASQAPIAPFYFPEPPALKLDIPYHPQDSVQPHPLSSSPLTTVGLPWENTLVGTQLSPSGMMDGVPVSALNFGLPAGEPLMPNHISNNAYASPCSPTMSRKTSTVSTAHSSTWSDAYAGTPRDSPCMSRKMSTVSPARSPSSLDESTGTTSSGHTQVDLYVSTLSIHVRHKYAGPLLTERHFRDQVYWEKVHRFAPIIHQTRYLSWSRKPDKSAAQTALQYSMWAMAASVTPEYNQLNVDGLYRCAVRTLQAIERASDPGGLTQSNDLEQVQAQLLLSLYELKHGDFPRGWITAGCAFRLIQFGWFQDLISGLNTSSPSLDWIELEEKRRTFWLAFYLDRVISLRSDSSCTFGEEVSFHLTMIPSNTEINGAQALIPLPVPDANFQSGVPAVTVYLADCLSNAEHAGEVLSSDFTESIIMATICGYALSHRRQLLMEQAQCRGMDRFWSRHRQIKSRLAQRADLSAACYPAQSPETEPALLFQSIMWRTIILYMYQTMNFAVTLIDEKHPGLEYVQEASVAAQNLVFLTEQILEVNGSKVSSGPDDVVKPPVTLYQADAASQLHPLTLIPLNMCGKLLEAWPDLAMSFSNKFRSISDALQGPADVSLVSKFSWERKKAPEIIVRE